jgi:hypothetical protein
MEEPLEHTWNFVSLTMDEFMKCGWTKLFSQQEEEKLFSKMCEDFDRSPFLPSSLASCASPVPSMTSQDQEVLALPVQKTRQVPEETRKRTRRCESPSWSDDDETYEEDSGLEDLKTQLATMEEELGTKSKSFKNLNYAERKKISNRLQSRISRLRKRIRSLTMEEKIKHLNLENAELRHKLSLLETQSWRNV